jgi:hypothetical protein
MKPIRDQIAERIVECSLVSHSLAFPIADMVLQVVGNGTIKALGGENARLRAGLERLHEDQIVEQEPIIRMALGLPEEDGD